MRVFKLANAEDAARNVAYEVFCVKKLSGGRYLLQLPRDQACNPVILQRELLKANAPWPTDRQLAARAVEELIGQEPKELWRYAAATGWQSKEQGFLIGADYVGVPRKRQVLPPGGLHGRYAQPPFSCRGTLVDWRRHVARPALRCPLFALAASLPFAAPLVRPCQWPNFGVQLSGGPPADRTLALAIAVSGIGVRDRRHMPTWGMSTSELGQIAAGFQDLLLPVADRHIGRPARHPSASFAGRLDRLLAREPAVSLFRTAAESVPWRGAILSEGAKPYKADAPASENDASLDAPVIIDLPLSSGLLSRSDDEKGDGMPTEALARAVRRYSGSPMRPYVEFLIEHRGELRETVRTYEAEFAAAIAGLTPAVTAAPVAIAFGRIFAGGCVAMQAGILPNRPRALKAALVRCFRAAASHARQSVFTLDDLKERLRDRLTSEQVRKAGRNASFGPNNREGFYRTIDKRRVYTVHARAFRSWFANRAQCIAVLRWLDGDGLLHMGERRYRVSDVSTEWAERGPRWPDGQPHKSYVFRNPFPELGAHSAAPAENTAPKTRRSDSAPVAVATAARRQLAGQLLPRSEARRRAVF